MTLTKAQIKHMVDRFLGWKLPENFNPDGGIRFKATFNEHTAHPMKNEPSGTNLFDATQADAMVRYMIEGMPTGVRVPDIEELLASVNRAVMFPEGALVCLNTGGALMTVEDIRSDGIVATVWFDEHGVLHRDGFRPAHLNRPEMVPA